MKPDRQPPEHNEASSKLAKRADLFGAQIEIQREIDWEQIAIKIGIIVSVTTILGFIISAITFLYTIQKDTRDYYEQQLNKIVDITNRQTSLEIKINGIEESIKNLTKPTEQKSQAQ